MNKDKLLKWLNWFYTLEMSQVELYLNQAKKSNDGYIANALLKVAESEAKHAEQFKDIIEKMGSKPLLIGKLASRIIGYIPGQITPLVGTVNLFLYNYTLETIAINDYKLLLNSLDMNSKLEYELATVLFKNMIEEDFHRVWFTESLKRLKTR